MDTSTKEIKKWYADNGVEFIPEDWGTRDDTGESAVPTRATNHYGGWKVHSRTRLHPSEPGGAWWWETKRPLWGPRPMDEAEWMTLLDEFFEPYLAMLNRPKGNILRQVINDRLTFEAIGENERMSKQGAWKQARSAEQDLVRLIAEDDPEFTPMKDGRRRDYESELAAAERVFDRYIEGRYSGPVPN